jgi:hypothetical protein
MNYINPIEILELQAVDIASIDNSVIKKAKRRLFADIELSDDGHLNYKGIKLTRSDCEKAIDGIECKNKMEFYSHLASNPHLNNFLINGDCELFNCFKQESIYKLPEFIDFISPYYSVKLDRALLHLFKNDDLDLFIAALRTKKLVKRSDLKKAYKSLNNEIQGRIAEIDEIKESIDEEVSDYTEEDIKDIIDVVKKFFPIEILNTLPAYFQSQINRIASSINYLLLSIFQGYDNISISISLLEHLLQLNIESVSKPTYEDNYAKMKKWQQDRIEQEKHAPLTNKWAKILLAIQSMVEEVEEEDLKADLAFLYANDALNLQELNYGLPSFGDEIKIQIGYSLRSLAVACWNKQADSSSALSLLLLALKINVSEEARLQLEQDKSDMEEIHKNNTCYFCETNPPEEGCSISKTIYKENYRTTSWLSSNKVGYSYKEVEIPRCGSCKKVHSWSLFKSKRKFAEAGIKDASKATLMKHPLLINIIGKSGWTFTKPTA